MLVLDLDLSVSAGVSDPAFYEPLAEMLRNRTAVVLPALETGAGGKRGGLVAADATQGKPKNGEGLEGPQSTTLLSQHPQEPPGNG